MRLILLLIAKRLDRLEIPLAPTRLRALWFSSCHAVPAAGTSVRRLSSRMSDAVGLGAVAAHTAVLAVACTRCDRAARL